MLFDQYVWTKTINYVNLYFQPPIDPMQLLNCLKVLLNEDTGGFKGPPEAMQISR